MMRGTHTEPHPPVGSSTPKGPSLVHGNGGMPYPALEGILHGGDIV